MHVKNYYLFLVFLYFCINMEAQCPKREMRATWIATVGGIDWPKSAGATSQKAENLKMLEFNSNIESQHCIFSGTFTL